MPPSLPVRANALTQLQSRVILDFKFPSIIRSAAISRPSARKQIPQTTNGNRYFAYSPTNLKKAGKARGKPEAAEDEVNLVEDPHDFSTLEAGIEKVLEKLKNDLSKLRTGGRFNPEILENARVHLSKNSKDSERLGDLAQVLPKGGRSLMVLVGDKDHVKPIISAIQGAKDLNLQPLPDPNNSSQLNIPVPPPTKESRDLAVAAVNKTGESSNLGIRNARGAMQKRLRAMELKKTALPDDLKKAHKDMEKLVEKAVANVKKTVEAARKAMEQT